MIQLEKTKQNLNLFCLLSEDYPKGSWKGRVILEIKNDGNSCYLQTSKRVGWVAILLDKFKSFFGINSSGHLPAVVEFIRKHQETIGYSKSIKILNAKIHDHNSKKINKFFKKLIPLLVVSEPSCPIITTAPMSTPESNRKVIDAAVCLNKFFNAVVGHLVGDYFSQAKLFITQKEGLDDLAKAEAIRHWMLSSRNLLNSIIELDLKELAFTNLPAEIGLLKNIKMLDLSKNRLTTLPVEIGQLKNLRYLQLRDNPFKSMPEEICHSDNPLISSNKDVLLCVEKMREAAICLNKCFNVIANSLNKNGHREAGRFLRSLEGKDELGKAKAIRDWMLAFPDLINSITELNLDGLSLTNLPDEIGDLKNLKKLDVSENQLAALPAVVCRLTNLDSLIADKNQLKTLPTEIWQLQNLHTLSFVKNQLSCVSAEIGQLRQLVALYLNHNRLTTLPAEIGHLKKLKYFGKLDGNPIKSLPQEIYNSDNPVIAKHKDIYLIGLST